MRSACLGISHGSGLQFKITCCAINRSLSARLKLAPQSPAVLKAQLYALTGVEPDRQKVMFKGKTIKARELQRHEPLIAGRMTTRGSAWPGARSC